MYEKQNNLLSWAVSLPWNIHEEVQAINADLSLHPWDHCYHVWPSVAPDVSIGVNALGLCYPISNPFTDLWRGPLAQTPDSWEI